MAAIRQVLDRESRFVKVHAAEYLLWLGYTQGVKEAFHKELQSHGGEPQYRIGIWRVLARCDTRGPEQSQWTDKICDVLWNPSAPDRVHAAETLAKLGCRIDDEEAASLEKAARSDIAPLTPYALWVLANSDRPGAERAISRAVALVERGHPPRRGVCAAASAFGCGGDGREATGGRSAGAAGIEGQGLPGRGGGEVCPSGRQGFADNRTGRFALRGNREEKVEACQTLAEIGGARPWPRSLDFSMMPTRTRGRRRPMPF